MLLSDRMQAVVGLAAECDCIADIGCDHGYVAIELIKNHTCKHVIAMDVNEGPLDRAKSNIHDYLMNEYIETRLSNGTEALKKGEADGMICAGMGGPLIISILEQGKAVIDDMKQLILQPQSEIDKVRCYLRENGYIIDKEDIIFEDGKFYPMMRVVPGVFGKHEKQMAGNLEQKIKQKNAKNIEQKAEAVPPDISEYFMEETIKLTRIQDTYGPYLLEIGHPVLRKYLLWQKQNFENIRSNLMHQKKITQRQQVRITELEQELSDIVFCLYNYFKY